MDFLIFIISMAVLIKGADIIIKESERIALHFNISEFVIGATLVALGTSLPEMAASIAASYNHKSEMAVANVLGSVILNITLVLGLIFLIAKNISPKRDIFAKDSTWALIPVFVFILMAFDSVITRFEGILFLILMVGYLIFLSKEATLLSEEIDKDLEKEPFKWSKTIIFLILGFIFVVKGADYAVESASNIAREFGISEWIIGLFLIAFGTSLPELIVSIVAAINKKADMSIGNIIGSNAANFTVVLGSAALVNPLKIDIHKYIFDISTALVVSVILVFITANRMYNKSAGIALLSILALFAYNSIVHL
ncbi:calcium/sodium antiporter [Nitrosophilus kaiyonis]|uniref:calcium/sodium antiporter n=1 Tax=Nitrosophilus kaiyonis TaxID=2930200 RepID=UPI0024927E6E|nr:calcium/sodium antiporter [Nitrosophilus kaiyonis]